MEISWFDNLSSIILSPLNLRFIKEQIKRLNPPRLRFWRVTNRSKRRNWLIFARFQRRYQRPMPTHTKPCNGDILLTDWKITSHNLRQFIINISKHLIILFTFIWCGINIITCWLSSLPIIRDSLYTGVSWAGVWEYHCQVVLFGEFGEARFLGGVVVCACQAWEEIESWVGLASLLVYLVFREVNVEIHEAVRWLRPMRYSL